MHGSVELRLPKKDACSYYLQKKQIHIPAMVSSFVGNSPDVYAEVSLSGAGFELLLLFRPDGISCT